MSRSVTLKDIAREANLSIAAASRALNGSPRVSETTRRRVVEISERLGYEPRGRSHRRRRDSRTKLRVALLLLESRSRVPVVDHYVSAVTRIVKEHDARLELSQLSEHSSDQCEAELRQIARGVDGLLVFGYTRPHIAELLTQLRVPLTLIGDVAPTATPPRHQVGSDVTASVFSGVNKLLAAGHRRIGFLCKAFPTGGWRDQWLAGYQLAMLRSDVGFDPALCCVIDAASQHEVGNGAAETLGQLADPPSAYVVPQFEAVVSFRAAMSERGINLDPEQFLLGGEFEPAVNYGLGEYPILSINADAGATHALKLLFRLIEGEDLPPGRMRVPCREHNLERLLHPRPQLTRT